jgi:phospholipid transport system transporter-binding protein
MLVLPQVLTIEQARDTLRMLETAMRDDGTGPVAVDASALATFDSSAVAVLLECRRLAQAWNRSFELQGAPAKLRELAGLYGVDALLGLKAA